MLSRIKDVVQKLVEKDIKKIYTNLSDNNAEIKFLIGVVKEQDKKITKLVDEMIAQGLEEAKDIENIFRKKIESIDNRIVKTNESIRKLKEVMLDLDSRFTDLQTSIDYVTQYQTNTTEINKVSNEIIHKANQR